MNLFIWEKNGNFGPFLKKNFNGHTIYIQKGATS